MIFITFLRSSGKYQASIEAELMYSVSEVGELPVPIGVQIVLHRKFLMGEATTVSLSLRSMRPGWFRLVPNLCGVGMSKLDGNRHRWIGK